MHDSEQSEPQDTKKKNDISPSCANCENSIGLPVLSNRTSRVVRRPGRIINLRRKLMLLKRGYREPEKHDFDFWTEEEDATLIKAYPLQTADEHQKLFPNRTMNAISKRARNHNLRKSPEVYSAIQSKNSSKLGLANFADYPLQALAQKHPDLKQAYDAKMCRTILKDLGILKDKEKKVEIVEDKKDEKTVSGD